MQMSIDLISALLFYPAVIAFFWWKRRKVRVIDKVMFVLETKKPISLMQSLSKYSWLWKGIATISLPFCLYFASMTFLHLFLHLEQIIGRKAGPGVALLLPGIEIPGISLYVPFWQGIISILILVIVHEFAHAISAMSEGVRVKSCGFGFFLFLPIAFVEIEEKELEQKAKVSQLRIFASGSFSNFLCSLFLLSLFLAITPVFISLIHFKGVKVVEVVGGSPAEDVGIERGAMIYQINEVQIRHAQDLLNFLRESKPGEIVKIRSSEGDYVLTLAQNPANESIGFIGIRVEQEWEWSKGARERYGILLDLFSFFYSTISWASFLNFVVALVNLLPLHFADGGRMLNAFLSYFTREENASRIVRIFSSLTLSLLFLNFFLPFFS